jgi:8-oxo-dGTP pyrophosphatase MutT (NUDIX family)
MIIHATQRLAATQQRKCAGCLILAQDSLRFLFQLRSAEVDQGECWGTWGGIEAGESETQAMQRELHEEARYDGPARLVTLLHTSTPELSYQNFLAVVPTEFTPVLNWESAGAEWVDYGRWPDPLHPGVRKLLDDKASRFAIYRTVNELMMENRDARESDQA